MLGRYRSLQFQSTTRQESSIKQVCFQLLSNANNIYLKIFQPLDEYNKHILKYISEKKRSGDLRLEFNMVTKYDFDFFFIASEFLNDVTS